MSMYSSLKKSFVLIEGDWTVRKAFHKIAAHTAFWTHFIFRWKKSGRSTLYYLVEKNVAVELENADNSALVHKALDLKSKVPTKVINTKVLNKKKATPPFIVIEKDRILGFEAVQDFPMIKGKEKMESTKPAKSIGHQEKNKPLLDLDKAIDPSPDEASEKTRGSISLEEEPDYYPKEKMEPWESEEAAPEEEIIIEADRGDKTRGSISLEEESGYYPEEKMEPWESEEAAPEEEIIIEAGRGDTAPSLEDMSQPSAGVESGTIGLDDIEDKTAFEAYPSIDVVGDVKPKKKLKVYVGFAEELDSSLDEVEKIIIPSASPAAPVYFTFMASGAKVINPKMNYQLALKKGDARVIECLVKEGATAVKFQVCYYYRSEFVGMASKTLQVANNIAASRFANLDPFAPPKIDLSFPKENVDLTIQLNYSDNTLKWNIASQKNDVPQSYSIPLKNYANPKEFVAQLGSDLENYEYSGKLAKNTLETKGKSIANLMPPEFFDLIRKIAKDLDRKPNVLLLTDEPYIPWELALMDKSIDEAFQPFLFCQVNIGRWWIGNSIPPPLSHIDIRKISAVAADYSEDSYQEALENALKERLFLKQEFKATPVEASKESIEGLISTDPVPGHLIHFALHGLSDPKANEQSIILKDGEHIKPEALIGHYRMGDTPYFSFFFLNACQVGIAGNALGQASGFPGILLSKGTKGFIAPLWSVDDVQALEFAKKFYRKVLKNKNSVGKTLREIRNEFNEEENVTALAYIYYGHPSLKLNNEDNVPA